MKITIAKSVLGGNGVFAAAEIKKDEVFEACPVVLVNSSEWEFIMRTKLLNYLFSWSDIPEKKVAFVLGYGMVYNHSYEPNCMTGIDYERELLLFHALRDISPGEELTHNYNGSSKSKNPVWFEVKS